MVSNNPIGDRQPQTGSAIFFLGAEERLKKLRTVLWKNAFAGIADMNNGLIAFRIVGGFQRELPALRHRLHRVGEKVGENLIQHLLIDHHERNLWAVPPHDGNSLGFAADFDQA